MKRRLPLLGCSTILFVCLLVLEPSRAWAAAITIFGPTGPMTFGLTPNIPPRPGSPPGSTSYTFNLNDFISPFPSPNLLPQALFTESELITTLHLLAGFGPDGRVDPIVASQSLEFDITGAFWRHHLTLTLQPQSFFIFSSDSVGVKGFVQHLVAPHREEDAPGPELSLDARMTGSSLVTLPPGFGFVSDARVRREFARRNIIFPAEASLGFDATGEIHPAGADLDVAAAILTGRTPIPAAGTFDFYFVEVVGAHVPEPSGFVLMGSGIVLCLFLCRRRVI
jgi:hypothetical protein